MSKRKENEIQEPRMPHKVYGRGEKLILPISFRKHQKPTILVYCIQKDLCVSDLMIAKVCAIALHSIYSGGVPCKKEQVPGHNLFGALITIILGFTTESSLDVSGLRRDLEAASFLIEIRELNHKTLEEEFKKIWGSLNNSSKHKPDIIINPEIIAVSMSMMMLIVEPVTRNTRSEWFQKQWKNLGPLLGGTTNFDYCKPPKFETCKTLMDFCHSLPICIRDYYLIIRALADSKNHRFQAAFQSVIKNGSWPKTVKTIF